MGRGEKGKKNRKGSTGLNKKESEAFLAKHCNRPEVRQTTSGLQFEVLERGDGAIVLANSSVTVEQRIMLRNGTVIADTYKSGEPDSFNVADAIPGYGEGLQLMEVGDRFKFVLPPDLAWGKKGTSSKIGPYEVIIIDCRLVAVT